MLDLEGLTVDRVVMHHIPKRREGRLPAIPAYGEKLINLPVSGREAFQRRITEALGKRSHGIEISLVDTEVGSFFQSAATLTYCNDDEFVESSKNLADRLAAKQANKDLAASKLIIVQGTSGLAGNKFLASIKADLQDGFAEDRTNGATHLENLFLTPTQRLYKIGFLQEAIAAPVLEDGLRDANNYRMYLFDHLMTALETRNAAHYFYRDFLGSDILMSDKKLTRDFYDLTTAFINSAPVDQERKVEYIDALRTELRSNRATVHTQTFAEDNFDPELQQQYLDFLTTRGLENGAFSKDNEYITGRLRKRQRMVFQHGVELSAPADRLHQLVTVQEAGAQQTVITINGSLERQE